jgi:hypothetical protein
MTNQGKIITGSKIDTAIKKIFCKNASRVYGRRTSTEKQKRNTVRITSAVTKKSLATWRSALWKTLLLRPRRDKLYL